MATVSAARAASTFPVFRPHGGGAVGFAWGTYEIASALSKDDIVEFFRLADCYVVDGFLRGDDIDTGTEAFELDIGTSADTDLFLNSGVLTGDAVTEVKPQVSIWMPFGNLLKDGPVAVTTEVTVIGTVVAAANAGGTGTLYCGAYIIETPSA